MNESNNIKSGICPKCGSNDVYVYDGRRGERSQLIISTWGRFYLETYLCTNCGHFEEYVTEKDLIKPEINNVIKTESDGWKKAKK